MAAQSGYTGVWLGPIAVEQRRTRPTDAEIAEYMRMIARRKAK